MEYDSIIRATDHFFPVLLVKTGQGEPAKIVEHLGSGFFLFPNVLVTCWHCVADAPPPGHQYAIRVEETKGRFKAYFLHNIEQDRHGTDMATALCPYKPPAPLEMAQQELLYGEDLWAFAYPFPETKQQSDGTIHHVISGRYLRGYMTRRFVYEHPFLGPTQAYELDMRAPKGASGAALLRRDRFQVVGVIFGTNDVETVEEFARIDSETGRREPELRRITSFALAYDIESFSNLTTTATGGVTLSKYFKQLQNRAG